MKNALLIALVSLTSVAAFGAPKSARLTHLDLDPHAFGNLSFTSGNVIVDTTARSATLTLYRATDCPAGRACSRVAYPPTVIELPLVSSRKDQCRALVYTAEVDRRRVDGSLQVLTITDHTTSECRTMPLFSPVTITYETDGFDRAGHVTSYSRFDADPFVSAEN
jgi:hypothetical protein